jgi:hypothetical protein
MPECLEDDSPAAAFLPLVNLRQSGIGIPASGSASLVGNAQLCFFLQFLQGGWAGARKTLTTRLHRPFSLKI